MLNKFSRRVFLGVCGCFLFSASLAFGQISGSLQEKHQHYLSALQKYQDAVQKKSDQQTISAIAEELRQAQQDYEKACGNAQQPDFPNSVGPLDLASDSAQDVSEIPRSVEEKGFDDLISQIYPPDRTQKGSVLLQKIVDFLKTAKNPYFIMQATFERADLTYEITQDPKEAEKILRPYAEKAPTPEARRMALARVQLFQQEKKVQLIRQSFEKNRQACGAAWQSFEKTSWFAIPSKLARLATYFSHNLRRKHEAAQLKNCLEEYDQMYAATYPQGTLDEKTHSRLIPGNTLSLLVNGRTSFARRFALAASAQEKIVLQTLLYHNDETGNKITDLLVDRAKAGVDVRVICDDAFAQGRKSNVLRRLENAGVKVLINNPMVSRPTKANYRSHQKIFLVDDEVAIVGGMNIANEYALGELEEYGWRDTDVEVHGPVVSEIGDLFDRNWEALTLDKADEKGQPQIQPLTEKVEKMPILPNRGSLIRGPLPIYFQTPPRLQNVRVRFLKTFPIKNDDDDILDLFRAYMSAARKEIIFESAYFIPSAPLKESIIAACKRGIKVKILTNSVESNNHPNAGYAGRANYEDVLKAGAEIYEWQGAQTIHSKCSLFDRFAVTIGAYNLNSRSHSCDSEDVISVEDRRFGNIFQKVLARDYSRARKVTLDDIEKWRADFQTHLKMDFFNLFKAIF